MHIGHVYVTPDGRRAKVVKARLTERLRFFYTVEFVDGSETGEFSAAQLSAVPGAKYPPRYNPKLARPSVGAPRSLTRVEKETPSVLIEDVLPKVGDVCMTHLNGYQQMVQVLTQEGAKYTVRGVIIGGFSEDTFTCNAEQLYR